MAATIAVASVDGKQTSDVAGYVIEMLDRVIAMDAATASTIVLKEWQEAFNYNAVYF